MAVSADIIKKVKENYPALAVLLNIPEVAALLVKAVSPGGLSPGAFQSQLMATKWFRSQSESMRTFWIESQTDPGTTKQKANSYRLALATAAHAYGAQLTSAQLNWLTMYGLQRGWEPGGIEQLSQFSKLVSSGAAKAMPGARRTNARAVQQMARGDYFYAMSKTSAAIWGDRIARGTATFEDVQTAVADKVAKLYPQFGTGLSQGSTMRELTDGHRQIIAEELELDPERIDFTQGRWSAVLGTKGSDGKIRPMTDVEVRKLARNDSRWWSTSHGKQTDATVSRDFLSMMGARPRLGVS
jgi:hypothetical protein